MKLFQPLRLREIELKNRMVVSPMCEYSAKEGRPTNWHMVHLGSRAVGGAALVFTEATAVSAVGRISPADTGIYQDTHIASWRPIVEFIREQGALSGIQLAHAGRKASTSAPWLGGTLISLADGGNFENRIRLPLRVVKEVRDLWPESQPVFVRISATDWAKDGWDLKQSIEFCRRLKSVGVDLIDVSSGGAVPGVQIPVGPGYQVAFAEAVRREASIATGAVGMISDPAQAETILSTEQADVVLLARELLRDLYWPRRAAQELGVKLKPPEQYERAW
jgi:2,4-dienoyl-CoA reductase-like NADH-dependent reductase (Old Yellow Enzyme family)